jgi:DNA-binding NtrC family response regulator
MVERLKPAPREAELLSLDVLLVDDEPDILEALTEVLVDCGHNVTTAASGMDAMACLDRRRFDVAICDVRLPQVDGIQLLHRIRSESPASDVILISAFGTVEEAVSAMKDKAAHYLTKPFRSQVLVDLVDRITQQKQLMRVLDSPAEVPGASIMGSSPRMQRVRELIATIASSDASVLITGESGTGKELVARALHEQSARATAPLVAVNCAAFPETLLEAELFGYERGAFTGAQQRRVGRFEAAQGGTLFLDEVAEMSLSAQVKLLRVLEQGACHRLGSNEEIPIDVRLVSATNVDVNIAVEEGVLRADFYHRLKVFQIHLPPLRERLGDLPVLIKDIHGELSSGLDQRPGEPLTFSPAAWAALQHYDFPGNVRELKHIIEHAMVLSGGAQVELEHLPGEVRGDARAHEARPHLLPLQDALGDFEREYLLRCLRHCDGQKARTAELLGISRKTLWKKLKRYALELDA